MRRTRPSKKAVVSTEKDPEPHLTRRLVRLRRSQLLARMSIQSKLIVMLVVHHAGGVGGRRHRVLGRYHRCARLSSIG